jgi:vitamin B12 transporter
MLRLTLQRFSIVVGFFVAVVFGFTLVIPAFSQSNATIEGVVTDPSDAAVPGAAIELAQLPSDNHPVQAVSSGEGRFQLSAAPGRYRLTITHPSLRRYEQELNLATGENRELHVQLALEPLSSSVIVSTAAQPIEATAASESVSILTRMEIDNRQITQIAPLLQSVPGVSLGQTGPIGGVTSLFLDGGNSNYTKVLIDGVPLNEPGGAVNTLAQLTLDGVDKIEVTRGAESALVGSDAMSGVVAVFTDRGSTRRPLLLAESDGGSFGTGRGMAQLSGLAGPLDYSLAGGYYQAHGQGPNDFFLDRTLSGNFGLRVAERDSLRLTLRSNSSDAGEPGQTLFTPPSLNQHYDFHDISAGLSWDFATGAHWQHRLFGFESDIHELFDNPLSAFFLSPDPFGECNFPRSSNAVPSAYCDFPFVTRNQFNRAGFQGQSTYTARHFSATLGYEYEVENGFLQTLNGAHATRNNQAGFVELRWQATGRLVVNAGFRVEDNASFGTRGVPRTGAAYTLRYGHDFWGATRLRFNYGQGIKEPSLDQSFGTDPCFPGNSALLPEQSRTTYAGVEQHLDADRIRVSGDFFYNQFRNIVSFTSCFPGSACPVNPPPGCSFGFGTFFNTDLARARGGHLAGEWQFAKRFSLDANYTYDDTRVLVSPNAFDPAQIPGNRLLRRPVNSGSLMLNAGIARFQGNVAGIFVGRRTDSDFLFPPLGLTSNPGYVRVDVAASYRVSHQASVIGHVTNLFNKPYQDVLGFPALGRAAYIGMRFRLGGE